jgi:hypothetical protein
MAMFGWDSPRMAEVYTRAAEQKRLAGGALFLITLERGNDDCRTPAGAPKLSMSNQQDRKQMAGVAGLEPATPGFGDRCSTN